MHLPVERTAVTLMRLLWSKTRLAPSMEPQNSVAILPALVGWRPAVELCSSCIATSKRYYTALLDP